MQPTSTRIVRRWRSGAAIVTSLALVLAACGDDDDDTSGADTTVATDDGTTETTEATETTDGEVTATTATTATTEAEAGDGDGAGGEMEATDPAATLTFAIMFGNNSLDPHRTPNSQGDSIWMRPLYDRLLDIGKDADGNATLKPFLAESYEVSDDGLEITFELRDDVTFWDGTAFDAAAVAANIERALGEGSTVSSFVARIESVEVAGPTTAVFHLTEPDPALLWNLAVTSIGMMINPNALDTDLDATPAGSGPYQLVSAAKDAEVVYERWDDYWEPGAAGAQELILNTILDGNVRYNGTRTGEYDATFLVPPADSEARSLTDEGYGWILEVGPIASGLTVNTALAPFDDVRVRQAVAMAIDKDAIAASLTAGVAPTVFQPFPPGFLGSDPDLEPLPYDPEAAAALIEEAGATGAEVTLIQQTPQEPQTSMALVFQQALNDIGLSVELLPLSPTEARPAYQEGGYHGLVGPMIAGFDPSQTLNDIYLDGAPAMPGPAPAELTEMAAAAAALPYGTPEREAAYQEISAYLVETPIHTPVIQFTSVVLTGPDVANIEELMVFQIGTLDFRYVGKSAG